MYGNFEVGKTQNGESPIMELSSFDTLQKWTNAAHIFNEFGVSTALVELFKTDSKLDLLGQKLSALTTAIYTCRGHDLNTNIDIVTLKSTIQNQRKNPKFIAQFNPLIDLIEEKVKTFQHQTVLNGLSATDWCITHNLIPQGYIFLQETLKSYVVEKVFDITYLNDYDYRKLAHLALNGARRRKLNDTCNYANRNRTDNIPNRTTELIDLTDNITDTYQKLTGSDGSRNDIGHCGYNHDPRTGQQLTDELKTLVSEIKVLNLS